MVEIIGVRFKNGGKIYFFNPSGLQINVGDPVIVETARGLEYGECAQENTMVEETAVTEPLRPVIRLATEEDKKMLEDNRKKEAWALEVCQQKAAEHNLDMKLVNVEYNFDGSKILFFFTSDGRVDFRELVKDLASVFRTRIELRQIGVRDEAKMLGGLGICGQPFCCTRFLDEFQPVSIKMAKTQNLSLNPTKISGTCGRLMCCLKYEQEAYEDLLKRTPKQDSFVETPDGVGTVSAVSLLREQAKVRLDIAPETPRTYPCSEIRVIRSGKGKRPEGYVSQEELQAAYIRQTMEQRKKELEEETKPVEPRVAKREKPGGGTKSKTSKEPRESRERQERQIQRHQQKLQQEGQKAKGNREENAAEKKRDRRQPRYHHTRGKAQQKSQEQTLPNS